MRTLLLLAVTFSFGCSRGNSSNKSEASGFVPPTYWQHDDFAAHVSKGAGINANVIDKTGPNATVHVQIGDKSAMLYVSARTSADAAARQVKDESGRDYPEAFSWGHFVVAARKEKDLPVLRNLRDYLKDAPASSGNQK